MRKVLAGVGLAALAACSGSSDAVGENSAGSIRTTAIGNVVGSIPSPTPTPAYNAAAPADVTANDAADGNAM